MKILGIAIALAMAGLSSAAVSTPATAQAATTAQAPAAIQKPVAAAPAVTATPADPHAGHMMAPPVAGSTDPVMVMPEAGIGQPDGRYGLQDQVTPIGREAAHFHDYWLVTLCVVMSIFVLILLAYAMFKFRRGANPEPSRTSHNTVLEVVWTLVPVLILVAIAIPSIKLLSHQYSPPKADLTIKVVGNQWYWTYSYPDNGGFEIVSNMLKEQKDVKPGERFRTAADGPPLLAVDERIVIPVNKVVKFIITSNDVIHSFAVPAFWTKMDAVPGRVNETWVKVDRPGVYFGQCSELCGARHGYMPIAVEVVSEAKFAQWIAAKGGTMPGTTPAAAPDSTGSSPVSTAATPAEAAPEAARTPAEADPAAVRQPVTNQAATAQN